MSVRFTWDTPGVRLQTALCYSDDWNAWSLNHDQESLIYHEATGLVMIITCLVSEGHDEKNQNCQ